MFDGVENNACSVSVPSLLIILYSIMGQCIEKVENYGNTKPGGLGWIYIWASCISLKVEVITNPDFGPHFVVIVNDYVIGGDPPLAYPVTSNENVQEGFASRLNNVYKYLNTPNFHPLMIWFPCKTMLAQC